MEYCGQECSVCPLDQAPVEKRPALFALRMILRAPGTNMSNWEEAARSRQSGCMMPVRESATLALTIDPTDPDVALAASCAANFDPPVTCEIE